MVSSLSSLPQHTPFSAGIPGGRKINKKKKEEKSISHEVAPALL